MSDGDFQKGATQEHYENDGSRPAWNWIKLVDQQPPTRRRIIALTDQNEMQVVYRIGEKEAAGFVAWCEVIGLDGKPIDEPEEPTIGQGQEWAHHAQIDNLRIVGDDDKM